MLVAAIAAGPAHANHLVPSGSVSLAPGAIKKDGYQEVAVKWSSGCSEGTASPEMVVGSVPRSPRGKSTIIASEDAPSGSQTIEIPPGVRAVASIDVTCNADLPDGSHTATATFKSGEIFVPPFLAGYGFLRNNLCWTGSRTPSLDRYAQVGNRTTVLWDLKFDPGSMLKSSGSARLKEITLRGAGTGVRVNSHPSLTLDRSGVGLGTKVLPRRKGKLKIFAVIGGVKTNTVQVPVLPRPRGC